ncbi:MAG: sulfatase-like hydrolase/transferase, partial [Burkholderiales bacterium]
WFLTALVGLHLMLGVAAWGLGCATAIIWGRAREKFLRYSIGWFAGLSLATVAYSALWYPRTLLGAWYHDVLSVPVAGVPVGRVFYLAILALAALVVVKASSKTMRTPGVARRGRATAATLPAARSALAVLMLVPDRPSSASPASRQPHVIIIGIDSLRMEHLARYGGNGMTPNLDAFIAQADLFRDTTTPLARTFPSWMAILTGRSPLRTGARFNLGDREQIAATPTIGDVLRKTGYHTIFAMDEVRFANIDETYGFDQLISSRMGAPDFLLGNYNELPLSSLVINTRLGQWLFPYSYGNRGAATMFQPETFTGRLEREVSFDRPTLFITHLTGAHWPYYTAGTPFGIPMVDMETDARPLYDQGLVTVDRMFGEIVEMLERKGALENAIVIVLSDHGEALGLPSDTFFANGAFVHGLKAPLKMLDMGHGQSVLSPSQYHVLLGFRAFGPQKSFAPAGRDFQRPASVEDISPTLLDLLGLDPAALSPTGQSLAGTLRTGIDLPASGEGDDRIRFTETDLRVLPAQNGGFDEDATAAENSKYFVIDPRTGRMRIRKSMAPLAIAYKEKAAFTKKNLLAAMPAGPHASQYVYFDLATGSGRLLLERPGADDPDAQRLWDALFAFYGAEARKPTVVSPADWPAIEEQWANYLNTLRARTEASAQGALAGQAGAVVAR